jgi:hypothetical protein
MFKELSPYLRQRAVRLTVTRIEEDQIRVNVIPQKLKEGWRERRAHDALDRVRNGPRA